MMHQVAAQLGPQRVAVVTGVHANGSKENDGLHVYRLRGGLRPTSALGLGALMARLGAIAVRERATLLQFATLEDAHIAYWSQRTLRLRHIFFAYGNEVLSVQRSTWHKPRDALLAAKRVVAVSHFTAGLLKSLGVRDENIRVFYPGCDINTFSPRTITDETRARLTHGRKPRHTVLTVGNLVERKGHDTAIRAMALLPRAIDVLYLIVGDGPYRAKLEGLAASLGVADRVLFCGRVPASDLPLYYSMADLFLMVSRERREQCDVEGFGIVFIEAAACGTPSIGGRSGGIEDAIVDDVTGVLVDPLDPAAVSAATLSLLRDDARRHRMGAAARRRAAQEFTWDKLRTNMIEMLDEIERE